MIMIMESYHHQEAPKTVRDSIGGCSMDMWCPDGIGRESWDREGREGIGLTPSPERGRFRKLVCFPSAGVGGASRMRIVVVVVEYIIILIIIIVVLIDFAELQLCQTVHLESSFFFKPLIFPRKVISRQIETFCCWLVFLWPAG